MGLCSRARGAPQKAPLVFVLIMTLNKLIFVLYQYFKFLQPGSSVIITEWF